MEINDYSILLTLQLGKLRNRERDRLHRSPGIMVTCRNDWRGQVAKKHSCWRLLYSTLLINQALFHEDKVKIRYTSRHSFPAPSGAPAPEFVKQPSLSSGCATGSDLSAGTCSVEQATKGLCNWGETHSNSFLQ